MKFKIIERKMPGNPTAPTKFYASIVRPPKVTIKTLAHRISEVSPVNELDTELSLKALVEILPEFLMQGATVELGDLGSLFVNLKSDGSVSENDFDKNLIKGNKIIFRPAINMRKQMKQVEYEKDSK